MNGGAPVAGRWTHLAGVFSATPAEAGVWVHLAGVYDGGLGQLRIYVNGVLNNTVNVSFTPFASSGPLLVGRTLRQGQLVDQWIGGIDDVAVFQGAMTDADVVSLYNS
ncbi:LamG-like jellyroll fold domain-containing protein [Rhizomonospora bruguierae]|uniref:LamG-like jellyroll fold domain-containing protein n=1 Tax=Rhizomonospora bruguierae TaxID=1581705 RepID=UPI0020BF580A|nr:LamG-like jellyroll fold domain-containing protein [Micromonospora sp. NBRC 107566]